VKNKPNLLNKLFFPEVITALPGEGNKIFLTFDDGPTPGITSQVLAFLSHYKAKATFFCNGRNVDYHRELFHQIAEEGHTIGNHGYSHLHGWYTKADKYLYDCNKAAQLIPNPIFRPPYGKITPAQYQKVKDAYTIYLWTALSWDFHPWVSGALCFKYTSLNMKPGSILVFHDTEIAFSSLKYALPRILELGLKKGYEFTALPGRINIKNDRTDTAVRESSSLLRK